MQKQELALHACLTHFGRIPTNHSVLQTSLMMFWVNVNSQDEVYDFFFSFEILLAIYAI